MSPVKTRFPGNELMVVGAFLDFVGVVDRRDLEEIIVAAPSRAPDRDR